MRNSVVALVAILVLLLVASFVVFAPSSLQPTWLQRSVIPGAPKNLLDLRLGLDLRGGTQIVLETKNSPGVRADAASTQRALEVLRQRVDALGVSEPSLYRSGPQRWRWR